MLSSLGTGASPSGSTTKDLFHDTDGRSCTTCAAQRGGRGDAVQGEPPAAIGLGVGYDHHAGQVFCHHLFRFKDVGCSSAIDEVRGQQELAVPRTEIEHPGILG